MNLPAKVVNKIATNPWAVLISNIGSIVSLGVLINEKISQPSMAIGPILFFIGATILYVAVSMYSLKIREDNRNLQEIAESFREINSIYRDRLFGQFYGGRSITQREKLVDIEKSTITSVCQRISQIYSKLIGKSCVVSVKLLTKENDGTLKAKSYARSENDSERDKAEPKTFEVNTGQNTAFDLALMKDTTGNIIYFYSGDLEKHKHYLNQRPNWKKYYRSTIVVPIRCPGVEGKPAQDDIGFLSIDTKSRNRLNNNHHVVMLAALADQMYNFMSLMRGKYSVSPNEEKNNVQESKVV